MIPKRRIMILIARKLTIAMTVLISIIAIKSITTTTVPKAIASFFCFRTSWKIYDSFRRPFGWPIKKQRWSGLGDVFPYP